MGLTDQASFVDITDAENPRYIGRLLMTEGANGSTWRDIKVYKNHAFIVSDGAGEHGMQVFNLARLREVGSEPITFEADAHYDGIASAHNIVINEGRNDNVWSALHPSLIPLYCTFAASAPIILPKSDLLDNVI